MPTIDRIYNYSIYFKAACVEKVINGEPIHIHISDKEQHQDISAKIWICYNKSKCIYECKVEKWGTYVKEKDKIFVLKMLSKELDRYVELWCLVLGQKEIKEEQMIII